MKTIRSNAEWKKWGDVDPLFGVATWKGRQKDGPNPWTDTEFYASGLAEWTTLRDRWERYGVTLDSCLEIGCGAGRLTLHLAEAFREVHGVDVSPGMIDYARRHVSNSNVQFHLSDGLSVPLEDRRVTAVLSTFVFQHFDSMDHAAGYFREIARVLRPGGTFLIQLPVHSWPSPAWIYTPLYRAGKWSRELLASMRGLAMRAGLGDPPMRHQSYDERFLFGALTRSGFCRAEIHRFGSSDSATTLVAVLLGCRG